MKGIKVITASVPPYGSIESRARALVEDITAEAAGKDVNIIAYVLFQLPGKGSTNKLFSVKT